MTTKPTPKPLVSGRLLAASVEPMPHKPTKARPTAAEYAILHRALGKAFIWFHSREGRAYWLTLATSFFRCEDWEPLPYPTRYECWRIVSGRGDGHKISGIPNYAANVLFYLEKLLDIIRAYPDMPHQQLLVARWEEMVRKEKRYGRCKKAQYKR